MTADDGAASPSGPSSSSSKRLSYTPYQRKGHSRSVSGASQLASNSDPNSPRSTPDPTSSSRRTDAEANVRNTPPASRPAEMVTPTSRSQQSSTSSPHRTAASPSPLRPQGTPSRTASTLSRPAVASPLARSGSLVRPFRDLDAPPPPLRVASKLASGSSQSVVPASSNSRPASPTKRAQAISSSAAPSAPSTPRQGSSLSENSAARGGPVTSERGAQKLAETTRTPTRSHDNRSPVPGGQSTQQYNASNASAANGGTTITSSAASSLRGSSKASSVVGSPHGSRSSTPIVGASGTSIPAHVNSYAALLAAQSRLGPIPVPQGVALAQVAGTSPGSGDQEIVMSHTDGRRTAYRSGFQPKGVLRNRTGEFEELRRKGRSEGEMEEQRMDRRLAKLIAIHFAPISDAEKSQLSPAKKSFGSSFIDLDFDELKRDPSSIIRKGGSELWTSFRARGRGEDPAIRQAEQSIVNWQDDAEAKACPICSTPFSFTVRKHHCRLCGRVVCASPHLTRLAWADQMAPGTGMTLTPEERAALDNKCSGNIIADPITGRVEEIKETSPSSSSSASVSKGVRVCHDCKTIVRRRQYMLDDSPLPVFLKLYEALMRVQKEIEQSLPEFQEMVLGLQKQDQTAALGSSIRANIELQRDAVQARKQLLANFASYDELAKRIRALKSDVKGGDAAQERIQHAIFTRANLFLQQNMLPLQSLPKPGARKDKEGNGDAASSTGSTPPASPRVAPRKASQHANKGSVSSIVSFRSLFGGGQGPGGLRASTSADLDDQLNEDANAGEDDELAKADPAELKEQLKVLLEQEKLVADYVESAAKARKFEDAKTLKKSHDELCKEIVRIQRRLVVAGQGR